MFNCLMFDVTSMLVDNSVGLSSDIQHVFKLCASEFNWLKFYRRSQCPRGLRRRSAAARLLRL